MSPTPLVSVVIATYNYGGYLPLALDSALSQTLADLEIIVVDDGSTDDTERVIQPYRLDPRIGYLRTDHLGQSAAKNAGIRRARGRYVAFLDADDLWLPTKLEKQIELFERSGPELGVVYCRRRWIDEGGRELDRDERQPHRGDVLARLFHRPFICFSSSMIRRAVLDDVGLFDESIPMAIDYDLWLRIGLKYHFDYVDERLVMYRTGHGNLSSRLAERVVCVREIIHRFLEERGGRERLDSAFVRMVLAEHCCDMAGTLVETDKLGALGWYAKGLLTDPTYRPAWKQLGTMWIPKSWKSAVTKKLRRPEQPAESITSAMDPTRGTARS
jgi:glycosyltransferase involved in cell wall biosynthesis